MWCQTCWTVKKKMVKETDKIYMRCLNININVKGTHCIYSYNRRELNSLFLKKTLFFRKRKYVHYVKMLMYDLLHITYYQQQSSERGNLPSDSGLLFHGRLPFLTLRTAARTNRWYDHESKLKKHLSHQEPRRSKDRI